MKKLLLVLFVLATAQFAVGQVNYFTDFNDSISAGWTVIDADGNDTTWVHDTEGLGVGNSPAVTIDTYDSGQSDDGRADDWLVSPQISVTAGDVVTFYARGGYDGFSDSLTVFTGTGSTAGDLTNLLDGILLESSVEGPGDFVKFTYDLTSNANIADGDNIYIGIYCNSNGSRVYVDNFKVAQPNTPLLLDAYSIDKNKFVVRFDENLQSPSEADFEFLDGDGTTLSDLDTLDIENSMYTLTTAANVTGNNVIDTVVYPSTPDTAMFYGGILPIEYTNLTNAEVVEKAYQGTYTGIVFAGSGDTYYVADDSSAYNSIRINNTDSTLSVGDSIIFVGKVNPYQNLTEIYPTHVASIVATGKTPYPAKMITGAAIDTSNAADTDPAEMYENVLVHIENITIEEWDGAYYFIAGDGNGKFRIGNDLGLFAEFDSLAFGVNSIYNVTGVVSGRYGDYSINPRTIDDVVLVEDNTAPEVTNLGDIVTNVAGQTVSIKSSEVPGYVYLVHEDADQTTVAELDAAVDNMQANKTEVTEADTYVKLSTEGLMTGYYNTYAVDTANNISEVGNFQFTIKPVAIADAQTLTIGDQAVVQSTASTGKVYMVIDDVQVNAPADLVTAVSDGEAASADVTAANTDIQIATDNLAAGTYHVIAVDDNDLMSGPADNNITLEEEAVGIEDVAGANIKMYPNPVVNEMVITADTDISRIIIFNALGQQVKTLDNLMNNNIRVNTSELKGGVYFISFENESGVIRTDKFVKSVK